MSFLVLIKVYVFKCPACPYRLSTTDATICEGTQLFHRHNDGDGQVDVRMVKIEERWA